MILKAKQAVDLIDQSCHAFDLVPDLIRCHENVSIILCEASYTEQSVERSGFFMSVHDSKLTGAQRQILIGAGL